MRHTNNGSLLLLSGPFVIAPREGTWDFSHVQLGTQLMTAGDVTHNGSATASALPTAALGLGAMQLAAVTESTTS